MHEYRTHTAAGRAWNRAQSQRLLGNKYHHTTAEKTAPSKALPLREVVRFECPHCRGLIQQEHAEG